MGGMLRTQWTTDEIDAFPSGEHDYFDRKSGRLISKSDFQADLAKAFSAFANSGGGHILIGVADDGTIDGVPQTKGRTCTREWIEQIIPNLVEPVPTAFRVHLALDSKNTIPDGKAVIVIDIDDSQMAPYQARNNKIYYHRVGGHSVPASHFFLEALRNRTLSPSFSISLNNAKIIRVVDDKEIFFVQLLLHLSVRNDGNITPSIWHIDLLDNENRIASDKPIQRFDFPFIAVRYLEHQLIHNMPILPGQSKEITEVIGISIERSNIEGDPAEQVVNTLSNTKFAAKLVTNNHAGEPQILDTKPILKQIDAESIKRHIPTFDSTTCTGTIAKGIEIESFIMEPYEKPNDHARFKGIIRNGSNEAYKKMQFVFVFYDQNDNLLAYRQTTIGILPPMSSRHWDNWIEAAEI